MTLSNYHQQNLDNPYYIDKSIKNDAMLIHMFLRNQQSSNTFRSYNESINQFLNIILKPLNEVNLNDILNYIDYLQKEYSKKSTVSTRVSAIRSLYNFGVKLGYLRYNPFLTAKVPQVSKGKKTTDKFLTLVELNLLWSELKKKKRNAAIGSIFITTGIRVGELCNIKWNHFFKDINGIVGLHIIDTKGNKDRDVKIRNDVWKYIINYRKSLNKSTEINNEDTEYLFITKNFNQLSDRYVRWIISNACKKIGINKKVSPHWFRHTAASLSLKNGADLAKVTENFGWSSIKVASIYLHNIDKLEDSSVDYVNIELG